MGSVEGNELGTPAPHKLNVHYARHGLVCMNCSARVGIHGSVSVDDAVWWQAEHNRQLGLEWREYIPVEHEMGAFAVEDCQFFLEGDDENPLIQTFVPPLYIKVE